MLLSISYNSYYEKIGNDIRNIDDELPFSDLSLNWTWTKIDYISFVTKLAGFEYTKNVNPNLCEKGIPLFKGKNVQNGKLIENFESFIPENISDYLIRSQLNKKAILVPYVGDIGNAAIFEGKYKAHLGSNVGKIEIYYCDSNVFVLEEYLLYYLISPIGYTELSKHKKATAQESISIDAIRNVYVAIPPLNEQQRIVNIIKNSMEKIELISTNLEAINDLIINIKRKILNEIFGENSSYKSYYKKYLQIKDLCISISSTHKEEKFKDIIPKGKYPVVSQSQHLIDGYSNNVYKIIDCVPVVVFGDHTKVVKYIDFIFVPGADGTKILKSKILIPKFFYYGVLFATYQIENDGYARHFSKLKKVYLPIPKLDLQETISMYIDSIYNLLDSILQSLSS